MKPTFRERPVKLRDDITLEPHAVTAALTAYYDCDHYHWRVEPNESWLPGEHPPEHVTVHLTVGSGPDKIEVHRTFEWARDHWPLWGHTLIMSAIVKMQIGSEYDEPIGDNA